MTISPICYSSAGREGAGAKLQLGIGVVSSRVHARDRVATRLCKQGQRRGEERTIRTAALAYPSRDTGQGVEIGTSHASLPPS
jgi:hypothetical protein